MVGLARYFSRNTAGPVPSRSTSVPGHDISTMLSFHRRVALKDSATVLSNGALGLARMTYYPGSHMAYIPAKTDVAILEFYLTPN